MLLFDEDLVWHLGESIFADLREGHETLTSIGCQDVTLLYHGVLGASPSDEAHQCIA